MAGSFQRHFFDGDLKRNVVEVRRFGVVKGPARIAGPLQRDALTFQKAGRCWTKDTSSPLAT